MNTDTQERRACSRFRAIFGAALLVSALAASAIATAAERAKPLDVAKKLAASGARADQVKALAILRQLARPGTTSGDEATYRYAELCLRLHAGGEKNALAESKKAFEKLKAGAGSRWGLRGKLGLLRVAAAEGRRAEAIRGLDRFLGLQTRCERAVEAAYFLGQIRSARRKSLDELRSAQRAFGYALELHRSVARYHRPLVSAKQIGARLAWVRKRIWELEAGELKVLFAKAEKLRGASKYDAAVGIYRRIRGKFPGRRLSELSGLRIPQCLFAKKQLKKAVKSAREFIALDPLGAYRGSAHLLVGDIQLEHFFSVTGSEPEFRCILDPGRRPAWVDPERQKLIAWRKLDPKKTPPSKEVHGTWKGVRYAAHERAGILEYLRRNYDAAAKHFEASARLKPDRTYGSQAGQGMAELVGKIRRKVEILPPLVLAERAERPKLVLMLASLYMAGWRDDRAMGLLKRVADGEFPEASLNQKAYAHVKMAEGLFYKRKDKEAIGTLKLFLKKPCALSPFAARALLQLSVVTNRSGDWAESLTYLDRCHARFPHTAWGRSALYQKAYAYYARERSRKALQLFKEYVAKYPDALPVKTGAAEYFINQCRKDIAEEKRQKSNG